MTLAGFIPGLLREGSVTVASDMTPFENDDLEATALLLEKYHAEDTLEMPDTAPAFHKEAALWAAQYLYYAVQLVMLRDKDEEAMNSYLKAWSQPVSPGVIYSADLCLRHLPQLLKLAKGLAPDDVLVLRLKETGQQ